MTWAPPKKRDVQIKLTPRGRYSVKVPHGHELADSTWFALILWNAGETYRKERLFAEAHQDWYEPFK